MRLRAFGKTGVALSEVGYGAWGIGGRQWLGGDDRESLEALRRAIGLGLNFIDTALAYNEGHSEKLVGEVVREAPDKVWVATKVPPMNRVWPAQPGVGILEVFPAAYIVESTETSLRNLGVEQLDLQQLHVWNPEWIASDEWRRAVEELKRSGKIRFFGVSINDHQPDSALELVETGLVDSVQVIFNIFDPTPADRLLPLCAAKGVAVLARCPLDEGSLTGTITEETTFAPGEFREMYFGGNRKKQVVERVARLRADLEDVPGTLAEIALQWVLSHPAVTTVIPGMRRVRNVEANLAVSDRGALPAEVMARLKSHAWPKNFYSAAE